MVSKVCLVAMCVVATLAFSAANPNNVSGWIFAASHRTAPLLTRVLCCVQEIDFGAASALNTPHGGSLVNIMASPERAEEVCWCAGLCSRPDLAARILHASTPTHS